MQEGLLSLEDTVLSFFPDVLPYAPCETMGHMKVRHLLTMATGHSREPWNFRDNQESDWVYAFLSSYVDREPGSQFVYNTPASYMLSAIVQKCTGMTVCEYLRPRLFDPLDIHDISVSYTHLDVYKRQPQYFTRLFKKSVGLSPYQYLIQYRMNASIKLLKDRALTVTQIAEAVGYPDTKSFDRAFRDKYGVSPGKFRKFYVPLP